MPEETNDRDPQQLLAENERKTGVIDNLREQLAAQGEDLRQYSSYFSRLGAGAESPEQVRTLLKETLTNPTSGKYPEWLDSMSTEQITAAGKDVAQRLQAPAAAPATDPDVTRKLDRMDKFITKQEQRDRQQTIDAKQAEIQKVNETFLEDNLYGPAKKLGLDADTIQDIEDAMWKQMERDPKLVPKAAEVLQGKLKRYDPKRERQAGREEVLTHMDETSNTTVSPPSDGLPPPEITEKNVFEDVTSKEDIQDRYDKHIKPGLLQRYAQDGIQLGERIPV